MLRIGRFRDMLKEMREILDRPRPITRALTLDRTRPPNISRRLDEHREIQMNARSFVQRMQSLHDDKFRRADLNLTHPRMRFETPLRHPRRATRAKFSEITGKPRKIRRLWHVAPVFRSAVIVGQIVISREHHHTARGPNMLGEPAREG